MIQLYEHNKNTYGNLIQLFNTRNRVACVQPTGTGKSFIMLKLIEDNPDKMFLITSPSVYIFEQIRTHAEDNGMDLSNCMFCTYQKIIYMDDETIANIDADYIILDEFHRLGSSEWGGKGIDYLLNSHPESKVLGTSATPIRYLDSMRNMADEIFDGCYAVNMTLAEAIRMKILPLPVYITAWYSFADEIAKIEKRYAAIDNQSRKAKLYAKIQRAKAKIANTDCGIEDVLKKHIVNKNGKYIIFCPNIETLLTAQQDCKVWFAGVNRSIKVYSVYTGVDDVKQQFEEFKSSFASNALKILLCVDMLNEGIHIKGIDGIVMLRSTTSANVFYQQLGRALSCSKSKPVIFDLVNNYETGDTANQYSQLMELGRTYNESDYSKDISFEIYDYVRDIRELLDDIYNTFEQSWDETFQMLCKYKNKYGLFPLRTEEYEGYRLGSWCANQRNLFSSSKLSGLKVKALEEIGFHWSAFDDIWDRRYLELKSFVDINGFIPTQSNAKKNKELQPICSWIRTQRINYQSERLSDKKIEKLTELGVELNFLSADELWEKNFNDLKCICNEIQCFPLAEEINDIKLKKWVSNQRKEYFDGKLSEARVEKLNTLNFPWDRKAYIWERQFKILERYVSEFHHAPSNSDKYCNFSVGQWYRKQLREMKNNTLSTEQANKLRVLDISYERYSEEQWMDKFKLLKKFIADKGRMPYSKETYEDADLYAWISWQRTRLKKGTLDEKYINLFRSINIDLENFSSEIYMTEKWQLRFEQLKRFIAEYGRLPRNGEVYEGSDVYGWIYRQQKRLRNGKLNNSCLEQLASIGVDLENFSTPISK